MFSQQSITRCQEQLRRPRKTPNKHTSLLLAQKPAIKLLMQYHRIYTHTRRSSLSFLVFQNLVPGRRWERSLWTRFCNAVLFGYLRTWRGCQKFRNPSIWHHHQVISQKMYQVFFSIRTDAMLWRNDTFFLLNRDSFFAFSLVCYLDSVVPSSLAAPAPGKHIVQFLTEYLASGTFKQLGLWAVWLRWPRKARNNQDMVWRKCSGAIPIALLRYFFCSARERTKTRPLSFPRPYYALGDN